MTLEASGLTFSYPGQPRVLDGLSFTLPGGTISAVLGPNGTGKTTLLDLCLGWRSPAEGTVSLDGAPLSSLSRRERGRAMSLVPQRENLRFDFTVEEYVTLGRTPHIGPLGQPGSMDREIVHEAMREAGILDLRLRSIAGLSGGEYQLMLFARSLSQEPSVLLLDEPTSQLDPANRLRVLSLMRRLAVKGIAVLYTSHDPETAALAADTVHLMKGGRFTASGAPRDVLTAQALSETYGAPARPTWVGKGLHLEWGGE